MFKQLVEEIIDSGLTEDAVGALVGASQPTINRIKLGRQKNLSYELGTAILKLHGEVKAKAVPSQEQAECNP